MKTKLLLFSALAFSYGLNAQITINSSNLFEAGDQIFSGASDTTLITPTPSGPNQNWDYSSLVNEYPGSINIIATDTITGINNHPNANLAFVFDKDSVNEPDSYYLYEKTNTLFNGIGAYSPSENQFSPYVSYRTNLPLNYNDTQSDSTSVFGEAFEFSPLDSAKTNLIITEERTVDAWGTIQMPFGSFNVLRNNIVRKTYQRNWFKFNGDASFTYTPGLNDNDTVAEIEHSHVFYIANSTIKFPLLSYSLDTNGVIIRGAEWTTNQATNVTENSNQTMTIYPNPAKEYFSIATDIKIEEITIYNLNGEIVKNSFNLNQNNINIENLNNGIYIVKCKTQSDTSILKLVKK